MSNSLVGIWIGESIIASGSDKSETDCVGKRFNSICVNLRISSIVIESSTPVGVSSRKGGISKVLDSIYIINIFIYFKQNNNS